MNTSDFPNPANPAGAAAGVGESGVPDADRLEQSAAALAGALDPSLIARMANAFFSGVPTSPAPSPGAALPSAPLFSAEPIYAAIPGTPAASASVPLTPNHNPGSSFVPFPTAGAALPSAPIFATDPRLVSQTPAPPQPQSTAPWSLALPASAAPPPLATAAPVQGGVPREQDLAALPGRLDSALAFVPGFDRAPGAAGGVSPETARTAGPDGTSYYFLTDNPAVTSRSQTGRPDPFPRQVQTLDLGALALQHRPEIASTQISGVRAFDPHVFRRDFPILDQQVNGRPLVWLDNGATTQKPQAVIDRLVRFYTHENSNIHRAAHTLAARSTDAYESAREKVRGFINAPSTHDIIFVRGATEGINLVAQSWGRRNVGKDDEIVVSHLEHHANIVPWQQLAAEKGAKLRVAPVDDSGQIILEEYEKLLNPRTRIVAFTQVSNALGTITPVREMAAMAHRHGARVLVDGAQGICHMPVDVQALDADFYIFSGHKMFGPTGIGVVYGRSSELEAMPPWQGGGNMIADVTFERTVFQGPPERFEAGTGNIADAVGLGAAIDYLSRIGMGNVAAYEHELMAYATQGLLTVPGLRLIGTAREKAGVLSFVLDECKTEDVGKALDREGIAVRAGHHCAQPILRRFGLEATVRPSLALYNTTGDIDALVNALLRIQSGRGHRSGF
ncbi:MAG: family 2A encapsulin nanocompartment cargo protein cysteine desulfurase [Xanthobacteraceae bacterium]|nr:family 2A encapsulin nanocompartment cargo protein cysteine desulfurase [Xanthobacteraceae bacterium]